MKAQDTLKPRGSKARTRKPKLEIHQAVNGEWYFRVVATNGKIRSHSETYPTRQLAYEMAYSYVESMHLLTVEDIIILE